MDLTSHNIRVTGTRDSSLGVSFEPCESVDAELDHLSIFKFSAADVFQHSPMGDLLNSLKTYPWQMARRRTMFGLNLRRMMENFASHPPPTL